MERIRNYIYYLLGIKDYTEQEIRKKVNDRFEEVDLKELNKIINYLKENNYIDDESYVKSFVSSKFNSGYGWNRIIQDLKYKKGLKDDDFNFLKEEYDWFEKAKEVKLKRFGEDISIEYKEMNKQKNYILRRGFSMEEVNYAFEQ
jgi:regulatory protein